MNFSAKLSNSLQRENALESLKVQQAGTDKIKQEKANSLNKLSAFPLSNV